MRGVANAAIDISDGLAADLNHILQASGCGAQLQLDELPLHPALHSLERADAHELALHGGDDYVLCACISPAQWAGLQQQNHASDKLKLRAIGQIQAGSGIVARSPSGKLEPVPPRGYQHFD